MRLAPFEVQTSVFRGGCEPALQGDGGEFENNRGSAACAPEDLQATTHL